jgi:hypothetical protein
MAHHAGNPSATEEHRAARAEMILSRASNYIVSAYDSGRELGREPVDAGHVTGDRHFHAGT